MQLISLFSGAGGLDLGFHNVGFKTVWACDNDPIAASVFKSNFPNTEMHCGTITKVLEFPQNVDGVIGGPPCQSWSVAGAGRGHQDPRGQVFHDYIRAIATIKPKFFLAENVPGMLSKRHLESFTTIKAQLEGLGYVVGAKVLNASNYLVPQDRKRVFILGYRQDLGITPTFPEPFKGVVKLRNALTNLHNGDTVMHGRCESGYSPRYMSRNRTKGLDDFSFTILASATSIPQHPDSTMTQVSRELFKFDGEPKRLSALECARIQTFPGNFKWGNITLTQAYRLIGNAVAVNQSRAIAEHIKTVITTTTSPS